MAPTLLFSLLAGALADVADRRVIMIAGQCIIMLAGFALAFLAWTSALTPAIVLRFTSLIGAGSTLYAPARQASIVDQVPPTMLPEAITLNSVQANLARSVGPAIGGAILSLAGAKVAFLVTALSTFGLLIVVKRWACRLADLGALRSRNRGGRIAVGVMVR